MNPILKITLFTFLITSVRLASQDTISIYYESGSSKIQKYQHPVLDNIPSKFDLSELDSIHFVGIADSIGNLKSNLKLSEKRARETFNYCKKLLPEKNSVRIIAFGEEKSMNKRYRRVDVILFLKPEPSEQEDLSDKAEIPDRLNKCYYIDNELIHYSNIRTVQKRKNEFSIIEVPNTNLKKKEFHYYATLLKNGDLEIKKVKWTAKTTGSLWWKKQRYVALIPKKDFEKFKIFKIDIPPCNDCSQDLETKKEIVNEMDCIQLDRFLMSNIQIKTKLFNRKVVGIRAPREYVNLSDNYYIENGLQKKLPWRAKRGSRKQNYFYTELPIYNNYVANITRLMKCCTAKSEFGDWENRTIYCATRNRQKKIYSLLVELGDHYQFSQNSPYASLGINTKGYFSDIALNVGTDLKLNLYSSLRYQFNFLTFPFRTIKTGSWQTPGALFSSEKYGRLYLGTELKSRFNTSRLTLVEQNLHAGVSYINEKRKALIPKIFIQYGIGYDYSGNYSTTFYPIAQVGLNIRILEFHIK